MIAKSALPLVLLAATMAGCSLAPAVVSQGDRVEVSFTCRQSSGELAATTLPDLLVGNDRKSPFYLPRRGPETVILTAGVQPVDPKQDRVPFEEEIIQHLTPLLVGLKRGTTATIELQAERYPAASPGDRLVRMASVRRRDKEQRVPRQTYVARTGKEPQVGETLPLEPLLNGRVSQVSDKEVVIQTTPVQGDALTTPFGPVTVWETATQHELIINTEKDRLVRTGSMVGRIRDVDPDREVFTVDYGHPFGGEKLECSVKVARIEHQPPPGIPSSQPAASSTDAAKRLLSDALKFQQEHPMEAAPLAGAPGEEIKAVQN